MSVAVKYKKTRTEKKEEEKGAAIFVVKWGFGVAGCMPVCGSFSI